MHIKYLPFWKILDYYPLKEQHEFQMFPLYAAQCMALLDNGIWEKIEGWFLSCSYLVVTCLLSYDD